MLSTADVETFLLEHGISAPVHRQGDVPDAPDLVVMIASGPGLSSTYDGEFERPTLRVQIRGGQSDPDSAEALGAAVDAALMDTHPIAIGGRHVTNVQQLGGPPAFLGLDDESARRVILQATYVLEIERA